MEAAILIAYNISKPIKTLAKHCDNIIDQDNYQENIVIKRNDEIGILSNAFNNMLGRIKSNIEKITEVTKFNEDILKSIPAGIITTDKDGRLLSINDTAKKLMHENKKQNVDLDILEKLLEQLKKTIETNKTINEVFEFYDLEGNTIYLDITTSLFISDENKINGAICSFYDISERKRFENNMDIVDRLTTLGQFAAGIAHEIRNPLTGMKTSIQVLRNRLLKDDNATNEKLFDGVIQEIDRINNLITGLLNFSKPKAPNYEKTDLTEVLSRSLALVNKTANENNISIMVNNMSETNIVLADKAQIEQIFLNIIKSSINAIGANGHIEILFNKLSEEKGNYAVVEFIDDGCGIDSKDIDKIFNPFFTKSSKGTGLGLSVVYELVKGNHGTIKIQSKINEGTKVTLEFPLYGGGSSE